MLLLVVNWYFRWQKMKGLWSWVLGTFLVIVDQQLWVAVGKSFSASKPPGRIQAKMHRVAKFGDANGGRIYVAGPRFMLDMTAY